MSDDNNNICIVSINMLRTHVIKIIEHALHADIIYANRWHSLLTEKYMWQLSEYIKDK